MLSFYKFYVFARRFRNDNRPTNQPQISGPFGKISFRSSMHVSRCLQRANFVSFNSFSLAQKIQRKTLGCWGWSQVWNHLCAFPDLLWLFAKCYISLIWVHLRSVAHLTDHLHAPSSLQARHWFHFYLWKAFHTWDHPQHPHVFLWIFCAREKLLNETKFALCRHLETCIELLKEIFPNGPEIWDWFVGLLSLRNRRAKTQNL